MALDNPFRATSCIKPGNSLHSHGDSCNGYCPESVGTIRGVDSRYETGNGTGHSRGQIKLVFCSLFVPNRLVLETGSVSDWGGERYVKGRTRL